MFDNRIQCGLFLLVMLVSEAQGQSDWYVSWGYNRSAYAASDVHIWGSGPTGQPFDLMLHDARANDMPAPFDAKVYFHPGLFTIPQFNARFGKRIQSNLWVSAGWDHMKYKLKKQWVLADGMASLGDLTQVYDLDETMEFHGDSLYWGPGFNLEHSDGLNFVRFSLEHQHEWWRSRNGQFAFSTFEAAGLGLVVCSTDFTWSAQRQKNPQHISGLGVGLHGGIRLEVHRRFFIQSTAQAGAVTLPWIRIQGPTEAGATQRIAFVEGAFAVGYLIGASHKNSKRACDTCPKW